MGHHRAETRAPRRLRAVTPSSPSSHAQAGKRSAGRRAARPPARRAAVAPAPPVVRVVDAAPTPAPSRRTSPGRRVAPRKSLFRVLPSAPILLGVAALAISAGGAVSAADPSLVGAGSDRPAASKLMQASALSGAGGVASTNLLDTRGPVVSRDSRRDGTSGAVDEDAYAAAEEQVKALTEARADVDKEGDQFNAKLALNRWHLPVLGYHLTARFGDYGLWSSYHTGLDFAGPSGTPIYAIANGTISSASYDGSYGNKTVETLEDGTELWYCHQTSFVVSSGETVTAGQLIGYIGSTGHVTGPHLHLEVRPGGGDPVDPYQAMLVHGVTP